MEHSSAHRTRSATTRATRGRDKKTRTTHGSHRGRSRDTLTVGAGTSIECDIW